MNRLENLSANKFVVVLCSHSDVKNTIFNDRKVLLDTWKKVNKWICRVQKHSSIILKGISPLLKSKIPKNLINLVGIQMIKWTKFHEGKFGLSISYMKSFLKAKHFMENGVIDREITARELAQDINLSISVRLKISCFYFLTDEIVRLWKMLSDHEKSECLEKDLINNGDEHLAQCANYLAKGIEHFLATSEDVQTFYSSIFKLALNSDSEVAAKHCWSMIDSRKREHLSQFAIKSIVQKISNISCLSENDAYDPEIFLYFEPYVEMLKFMYHELETEQFKQCFDQFESAIVLEFTLHWPYHQLFIVISDLMWGILNTNNYYALLHMIVYKMNNRILCGRNNYKLLFRKFWIESPHYYKSYVFRMERDTVDDYDLDDYDYDYLISSLFNLKELTDFDLETLQMILGNCSHDEKEGIVREQGIVICQGALENGNFKLADLLIDSCLTDDARRQFKRNLLSTTNFGYIFRKLVSKKKLKLTQKIFVWALDSEEIEVFKKDLLHFLSLEDVLDYFCMKPSIGKKIDKYLNWILSPDEAVQFKKNLVVNTGDFINLFMHPLKNGNFEIIDEFLQWIFQTEIEVNSYKANLAFTIIDHSFCIDIRIGLDHVINFINWSKINEIQRIEFKYEFAFLQSTITYFREFVDNCNLLPVNEFIEWTQMSDVSIKEFKKRLMIYEYNIRIIALYSDLIRCGKHEEVDFVIEWSKISGKERRSFKKRIRKFCLKNIFVKNIDLRKAETQEEILSLIKWSPSMEEGGIIRKMNIALRKINIPFTNLHAIDNLERVENIFKIINN